MVNKKFSQGVTTELEKAAIAVAAKKNRQGKGRNAMIRKKLLEAAYVYVISRLQENDTYENNNE